jgi:hypothetical protein
LTWQANPPLLAEHGEETDTLNRKGYFFRGSLHANSVDARLLREPRSVSAVGTAQVRRSVGGVQRGWPANHRQRTDHRRTRENTLGGAEAAGRRGPRAHRDRNGRDLSRWCGVHVDASLPVPGRAAAGSATAVTAGRQLGTLATARALEGVRRRRGRGFLQPRASSIRALTTRSCHSTWLRYWACHCSPARASQCIGEASAIRYSTAQRNWNWWMTRGMHSAGARS